MNSFSNIGRFQDVIIFKPRSGPSFPTHPDWEGKTVLMPSSVTGFGVKILKVEHGMGNELISEKDLLRTGDIIIARGNKPEQVGNAGVVPDKAQGWVCANLLMRLQVDETKVSPHFCIYWLRSPFMRRYIKQRITGTNPSIQKINQQIILNLPFPTSIELDTQDTIVAHLDEMQKKVDTLTQLRIAAVRELDALLPSILDKAFKGEL
jgi:type I restriction enzyme S subunit